MSKLVTLLKNPRQTISAKYKDFHYRYLQFCLSDKVFPHLPDKVAISVKYEWLFGKKPNLKNPKTFNEKLQWLKLHDRNPLYHTLVDKAEVKKWVADRIGEEYIIPTYGVYNSVDEIDFDALPNQFVLKCTHDSASVIICKDKSSFNIESAKEKLNSSLHCSLYLFGREWAYKGITPRIIVEKYMEDDSGELMDYKVFTFDGVVKAYDIHFGRFSNHRRNMYDTEWRLLPYSIAYKSDSNIRIAKPRQIDSLKELAETLSRGFIHARIDFYIVYDRVYFGEITLYNGSGFDKFTDESADYEWGSWINLRKGNNS